MKIQDDRPDNEANVKQSSQPKLDIVALDDDRDFREFLESMLATEGHAVRVAAKPRAFYKMCEERLPDVTLLDIKMGDVSGEDVLTEIRKRWPHLCVIVVTGYPSLETMRSTFKQDVFDYVEKPFSMEQLRATLAQAAETFDLGVNPQDRLRIELGRRVRLARTAKGWTLRELSDASAVSVSQISSIERGAHLPSVESLLMIARALDAKPSEWFAQAGF